MFGVWRIYNLETKKFKQEKFLEPWIKHTFFPFYGKSFILGTYFFISSLCIWVDWVKKKYIYNVALFYFFFITGENDLIFVLDCTVIILQNKIQWWQTLTRVTNNKSKALFVHFFYFNILFCVRRIKIIVINSLKLTWFY